MNSYFTPRTIAKFATQYVVHSVVGTAAIATLNQVTDTDPTEPSQANEIGGSVIGLVVAMKLRSRTDVLVDRVADWNMDRKVQKVADHIETNIQ